MHLRSAPSRHQVGTKLRLKERATPPSTPKAEAQAKAQAEAQSTLTGVETALLTSCASGPKTGEALRVSAGYSARTGNFKAALTKLLTAGLIQMALPDKPRSPKQRYRITPLGRQILNKGQIGK